MPKYRSSGAKHEFSVLLQGFLQIFVQYDLHIFLQGCSLLPRYPIDEHLSEIDKRLQEFFLRQYAFPENTESERLYVSVIVIGWSLLFYRDRNVA